MKFLEKMGKTIWHKLYANERYIFLKFMDTSYEWDSFIDVIKNGYLYEISSI